MNGVNTVHAQGLVVVALNPATEHVCPEHVDVKTWLNQETVTPSVVQVRIITQGIVILYTDHDL